MITSANFYNDISLVNRTVNDNKLRKSNCRFVRIRRRSHPTMNEQKDCLSASVKISPNYITCHWISVMVFGFVASNGEKLHLI